MSGFQWDVDPERAFGDGMDAWTRALDNAIFTLAQFYAPQMESWMKMNAPWTDRSSAARQTLWAVADRDGRTVVIEFGYGVFYGKYLEYKNGGRFAIIAPALDHWSPIITDAVNKLLK
jgi:hypothetical protein